MDSTSLKCRLTMSPQKYNLLVELYKGRGKHRKALELLNRY